MVLGRRRERFGKKIEEAAEGKKKENLDSLSHL